MTSTSVDQNAAGTCQHNQSETTETLKGSNLGWHGIHTNRYRSSVFLKIIVGKNIQSQKVSQLSIFSLIVLDM
jgi:hypothetical protein